MLENDSILDYEEQFTDPDRHLASTGKRLANYLLDRVGVYALIIGLSFLIEPIQTSYPADEVTGLELFLFLFVLFGYWAFTEHFFGKSPAKFITKTTVVTEAGTRPTFGQIAGRTLSRLIPFEQFSFLGKVPVGWHDSISKTRVVNDAFLEGKRRY
jgi:uncharacterized RDD family membrane protein YckC